MNLSYCIKLLGKVNIKPKYCYSNNNIPPASRPLETFPINVTVTENGKYRLHNDSDTTYRSVVLFDKEEKDDTAIGQYFRCQLNFVITVYWIGTVAILSLLIGLLIVTYLFRQRCYITTDIWYSYCKTFIILTCNLNNMYWLKCILGNCKLQSVMAIQLRTDMKFCM